MYSCNQDNLLVSVTSKLIGCYMNYYITLYYLMIAIKIYLSILVLVSVQIMMPLSQL